MNLRCAEQISEISTTLCRSRHPWFPCLTTAAHDVSLFPEFANAPVLPAYPDTEGDSSLALW